MNKDQDRFREKVFWLCIAAILTISFLLFRSYVVREIAWGYPANYDQSTYLLISYSQFEALLREGVKQSLLSLLFSSNANGIFLHLIAVPTFLLFGASRLSALSVNYVLFSLFFLTFILVIRSLTQSRSISLLGAGLLLGAASPFWGGGLIDYRLDFSAFCVFGVFVSLVIQSKIFLSKKWSVAAGGTATILILTRFLTVVYLAGIYGLLLAYFLLRELYSRQHPKAYSRTLNVLLSGGVIATLTGPFLWINRKVITDYYIVGQLGPERFIRAKELGIANLVASLTFYPTSLIEDHLGIGLSLLCLGITGCGIGLAWKKKKRESHTTVHEQISLEDSCIFIGVSFLVILLVLTTNTSKSSAVGGILVPLFLWITVLVFFSLVNEAMDNETKRVRMIVMGIGCLSFGYGLFNQIANYGKHSAFSYYHNDIINIRQMYETIGSYSEEKKWINPVVTADSMRDYFVAGAISVLYYENHGVLIYFRGRLGASGSVFSPAKGVLSQIEGSDFLILTHKADNSEPPYPIVAAIEEARPQIERFAGEKLVHLAQYKIFNRDVDVYARPSS